MVLHQARALLRKGHEVTLVFSRFDPERALAGFPDPGFKCISLEDARRGGVSFDLALATWWETYFDVFDLRAETYAYFVQSDERRFYGPDETARRSLVQFSYQFDRAGIITEASWIKALLEQQFGLAVEHAPNGVDRELFNPNIPALETAKKRFRVLIEGPGSVPYKRIGDAFAAAQSLKDAEIWYICSDGVVKREWKPDRVFSAVPYREMASIYRSCDVLLKLSAVEGVFGPPLEMMACGGCCVVSNVSGYDEYIRAEHNALVVPVGQPALAVQALQRLHSDSDLRSRLIQNGLETAAGLDWPLVTPLFEKALQNIISRRHEYRLVRRDQALLVTARQLRDSLNPPLASCPDELPDDPVFLKKCVEFLDQAARAENARAARAAKQALLLADRTVKLLLLLAGDLPHWLKAALRGRTFRHPTLYRQYLRTEYHQLFDPLYYCSRYPDIKAARIDPLMHFLQYGAAEERSPSAIFDTSYYLLQNPDVKHSGVNPLLHFYHNGCHEGRYPSEIAARLGRMPYPGNDAQPSAGCSSQAQTGSFPRRLFSSILRPLACNRPLPSRQPMVSVIIPCFNYGHLLPHALESVKRQTFTDFEVLIVEGGSTDGTTPQVVSQLCSGNIRMISQSRPCNAGQNRLAGLLQACGRYVVFLDPDDQLEETYLEKSVFLAEVLGVDVVTPDARLTGDRAANIKRHAGKFLDTWKTSGIAVPQIFRSNSCSTVALFRRDFWSKNNIGYRTDDATIEDWDFWCRMASKGATFAHLPEPLHIYTIHARSLTQQIQSDYELKTRVLHQTFSSISSNPAAVRSLQRRQQRLPRVFRPLAALKPAGRPADSNWLRMLVFVPWFDAFGSSALLSGVFSRLKGRRADLTVLATEPATRPEQKDGLGLYKRFASSWFDINTCLCGADPRIFLRYLIESREINSLLIIGSRFAYDWLRWIKKSYPHIKAIDHLYNPYGHVARNRELRDAIDFNIVANTEVRTALLERQESEHRIRIIPHGVDTQAYSPEQPVFRRARESRPETRFTFGFLGRLSPEKRPGDVLELAARLPDCMFYIAGRGMLENELAQRIRELGIEQNCFLKGRVNDASEFYAQLDALLITSDTEGLPITLLEAMSLGLPAISTSVGHIPELIQDGINGYLYRPRDIDRLAAIASELSSLPAEALSRMGASARNTVVSRHDIALCAGQYEDTFRMVLG